MFKISDFATIFCTGERTISNKIRKFTPLLKIKDKKQRKHFYTVEEAKYIIFCIGLPPNNEYNRKLKEKYKDLF